MSRPPEKKYQGLEIFIRVDIFHRICYNKKYWFPNIIMTVISRSNQKNKYRITLELEVDEDFNPYELNWRKVFNLSNNERIKSYIEDLSLPFNFRWKN